MTAFKYSMVFLLSLLFSGTLASQQGYTLLADGGTMCIGGSWKYIYDMEDLSVCMNAVLVDPTCSNDFFGHSLTDGNCWCVPKGTDCTTEFTNQSGRNTYKINYKYELIGNGRKMCGGNGGHWTHVKNLDDPSVCMGTVLANPSCSNDFFSHSRTDGNCWCVPKGTDCTDNMSNHNGRDTYSIVIDTPVCCQSMTADCLACAAGITAEEYCEQYPTTSGCEEPTPEPTDATPEPTDATPEPTDATPEPTDATPEPTDVTMEPTDVTMEPTDATMEPTDATPEPTDATMEPTVVTTTTMQPTAATMEPTVVTTTMEPIVVTTTMEPIVVTTTTTDPTLVTTTTMQPTESDSEEDSYYSDEWSMDDESECPAGTESMTRDGRAWCRCEYSNFGVCGAGCGCADTQPASPTECGQCGSAKLRDGFQNNCRSGLVAYDCGDDGCACGQWLNTEENTVAVGSGRLLRL